MIEATLGKTKAKKTTPSPYFLMHKDLEVALLAFDYECGVIASIDEVKSVSHLPLGSIENGEASRNKLNEWWEDRAIPSSRKGLDEALTKFGLSNARCLLLRSFGLSLSDQYWIKPKNSGLTWGKVNFFQNEFSSDVGGVLFGADKSGNNLNFSSPDSSSEGFLKKRWKIENGERILVKGGSSPFYQEPFNEVIASRIASFLGISHVPYVLLWDKGLPYCACPDFVDANTELIPAWRLLMLNKPSNNDSSYTHLLSCCEALGIKGAKEFLDKMIVFDYLLANEDRHFNNFGALRNADGLVYLGMAPLFDSGSSLGYKKLEKEIRRCGEIESKPFSKDQRKQLGLVSSFSWLDADRLDGLVEIVREVLALDKEEEFISSARTDVICFALRERVAKLKAYIAKRKQ